MTSDPSKTVANMFRIVINLAAIVCLCEAHNHGAYMRNSADGFHSRPNWMGRIRDDARLSDLAIPGTHDSATYAYHGVILVYDIVATQTLSFEQQLLYGIRFFDIRSRHVNNELALHHGRVFLHLMMSDFLNSVDAFLKKNPSETVLFRLRKEHDDENNSRRMGDTLKWYLDKYPDTYLRNLDDNITLGRARGKFVILSDYEEFSAYGINYKQCTIQDDYNLRSNWDLYGKWERVKYQLENARNGDTSTFYINYLSGSGASFPYFVASGHVSSATSASRLSTGLATPLFRNSYPDFPRVTCFIRMCTIAFEGTNILTYSKVRDYNNDLNGQKRTIGLIVADFPGDLLIDVIIRNNDKLY